MKSLKSLVRMRYSDEYCRDEDVWDVHSSVSGDDLYLSYNAGVDDVGWFIPAGLVESDEEFRLRQDGILSMVDGYRWSEVADIVQKYWLPRTTYGDLDQFVSGCIVPRAVELTGIREFPDSRLCRLVVDFLVLVGWDPLHTWRCSPPVVDSYELKLVLKGVMDLVGHGTYLDVKNEYLQLFPNGIYRVNQWVEMMGDGIDEEDPVEFLSIRNNRLIRHLLWLVKVDDRAYSFYRARVLKKVEHQMSLRMNLNDSLMTEESRLKRDLMLDTAPHRGDHEFSHVGHNRIRDNIVGEHVLPADYLERREEVQDIYVRKENRYMEEYISMLYANTIEHPEELDDALARMDELPVQVRELIEELYEGYSEEMLAVVVEMAANAWGRDVKKARWSRKDALKHVLELVRDLVPVCVRVAGKLDPDGYEEIVEPSKINLIGAIRVVLSNPDAMEEFYRMGRRFGSQDPKWNRKIVEQLTELACEVINQTEVNTRLGKKNPQSILLRKEHPRNPKSRVDRYFERYCSSDTMGNDQFDVVSGGDSERGHQLAKTRTVDQERDQVRRERRDGIERSRAIMRKKKVSGLNDAMERYLPELDEYRSGRVGTDLFESRIDASRKKKDRRMFEEIARRYDLPMEEMEEIDLSRATLKQLTDLVKDRITDKARMYLRDLLRKFDREARNEYDETEEEMMNQDRINVIRNALEDMLSSGDPDYILDGEGKRGSYQEEDTNISKEDLLDDIQLMTEEELNQFIDNTFDERTIRELVHVYRKNGNNIDAVRKYLEMNIDRVLSYYNGEMDKLPELTEEEQGFFDRFSVVIRRSGREEILNFVADMFHQSDIDYFQYNEDRMTDDDIREEFLSMLRSKYDVHTFMNIFEAPNESIARENVAEHRRRIAQEDAEVNGTGVVDDEPDDTMFGQLKDAISKMDKDGLRDMLENVLEGEDLDGALAILRTHDLEQSRELIAMLLKSVCVKKKDQPDEDDDDWDEVGKFMAEFHLSILDMGQQEFIDFLVNFLDEEDAKKFLQDIRKGTKISIVKNNVFKFIAENYDNEALMKSFFPDGLPAFDDDSAPSVDQQVSTPTAADRISTPKGATTTTRVSNDRHDEDDLLDAVLGSRYLREIPDEDEPQEEDGIHFGFGEDSKSEESNDARSQIFKSLIQHVPSHTDEDELEREKSDFYYWMIKTVPDVNGSRLNDELDQMSSLDFMKFKTRVENAVKNGELRTYPDEEEDEEDSSDSYGKYSSTIGAMRGVKPTVNEEEEEEESDEEAMRNFRRILYRD